MTEVVETESPNQLDSGDRITISVSHQVYISGDQSWIKLEVNGRVRDGEDGHAAIDRVNDLVAHQVMTVIDTNVALVEGKQG